MIFDFFLSASFKGSKTNHINNSFKKMDEYRNIKGVEKQFSLKNCYISLLYRLNLNKCFERSNSNYIFIYGTVFSNNKFRDTFKKNPKQLNANEISSLYQRFENEMSLYIKGSFIIIIYKEDKKEIILISDRMNVMPLYYYFNKDRIIISSSMKMILNTGISTKELNHIALTEQLIFDYTLYDHTFFKDIFQTLPASIYRFSSNSIEHKKYWETKNLYNEKRLDEDSALEKLANQLYENVNLYASDSSKLLVAFTGGFDGRTNVAMLNRPKEDFLCFSFGMRQSKQIRIPQEICSSLGLNYEPVILGKDFEKEYSLLSDEVINFSNGTAPIIRANYPYAFKKLNDFSSTAITGLFGSEILRPLHNLGIMMNSHSERLFLSGNINDSLSESFKEIKQKNYINNKIIDDSFDHIYHDIDQRFFQKYKEFSNPEKLFFFLLEEGIRKYFMQEIQHERVYITNRFPYFDDDLLDIMYKTPFAGIYNGFLGKSKVKRRKGQLLYAYIIKKFMPVLGTFELDRGYKPQDLLRMFPFNYFMLLNGVIRAKTYNRINKNDTFQSEKWSIPIIKDTVLDSNNPYDLFDEGFNSAFSSGNYINDFLKYTHLISLKRYLSGLK